MSDSTRVPPNPTQTTPTSGPQKPLLQTWQGLLLACIVIVGLAEYTGFRSELTVGKGGFMAAAILTLLALSWRIWPKRARTVVSAAGESDQLRDTRWTRDAVLVFFYIGCWGILLCAFQFLAHEEGSARLAFGVIGAATVTASAAAVVGALLGFLFAIPRSLSKEQRAENSTNPENTDRPPSGTQRPPALLGVNTNLEEISDWLTKIIVGLGLINLEKIPGRLVALGVYFGEGFGELPGRESVALALLILFGTSGFLMGYLLTRLYLAGAFHRALSPGEALLDVVSRIGDSSAPPVEVIKEVEDAAGRASAEQAQRLVRKLARDYENTRRDMSFSPQRTAALDHIVIAMKGLASSASGMLEQLMSSTMAGERLAAVAFLGMNPDPRHIKWLGARFNTETPFIMYHTALALERLADLKLTDEQKAELRGALDNALTGIPAKDTAALAPIRRALERLKA